MLRRPALTTCAASPAAAIELLRVSRAPDAGNDRRPTARRGITMRFPDTGADAKGVPSPSRRHAGLDPGVLRQSPLVHDISGWVSTRGPALLRRPCVAADTMLATIRINIPKGTKSQRREEARRSGTIPATNAWNADAGPAPTSFFIVVAMSAAKTPPPKRRGQSIPWDQSPLRRDQISVKLSSPSPFTSEA